MPTNDLDDLMSRIEDINAKHPTELTGKDIDDIIAYHRRCRAKKASGEKPQQTLTDLSSIMAKLAPQAPVEKMKRRI
jgi:hypothetical protein